MEVRNLEDICMTPICGQSSPLNPSYHPLLLFTSMPASPHDLFAFCYKLKSAALNQNIFSVENCCSDNSLCAGPPDSRAMLVLVTDPSPPDSLPHIDPYHTNNVSLTSL